MNNPILSQDEIEALLHRGNPKMHSEELEDFLKLVAQSMTSLSNEVSLEFLEIQAGRPEHLTKNLKQWSLEELVVVAADVGESQILMLMSSLDATHLGERLRMPHQEAVQILGQAWVKEVARLMNAPHQVYQAQSVGVGAIANLSFESNAYLVYHSLEGDTRGLEFRLIIQDGDGFDNKVRQAMGQMHQEQALVSPKGRLLKGNKSPVTRAIFTSFDQVAQLEGEQEMNLLEDIDLTVTVELGQTTLTLNEILELSVPSVIRLERHAGEPVDVFINNTKAAKAEVVVLEDNFGVRILEIVPKSQRVLRE